MRLKPMNLNKTASFLALLSGIAGATLLSFDSTFRNVGYFPFLLSAILSCILLWKLNKQLFILNATFGVINLNGIIQFFVI